jgi:hypothetical protein
LTLALLLVTPVVAATPLVVAKTAHARPKSDVANVHDRLEPYVAKLNKAGLEQLEPVERTPVGRDTRFRDLDGLIVEYVEHDAGS